MADEKTVIPAIGTEGKYLDRKGLAHFWAEIKKKFVANVEAKTLEGGDIVLYKTINGTETEVANLSTTITTIINAAVGAENKEAEATITLGDESIKFFVEGGVLKTTVGESTQTLLDVSGLLDDAVNLVGFDATTGKFYYTTADGGETKNYIDATPVMGVSVDSTTAGTNKLQVTQAGSTTDVANVALTDKANTYTEGAQNFEGVLTTVSTQALDGDHANDTAAASTKFVNDAIKDALGDLATAMVFKGGVASAEAVAALTGVKAGYTYVATADFTLGTEKVETGDLLIAKNDTPEWIIIQRNEDSVVSSTAKSSVGGEVALYDGTSGKIIGKSVVKANADGHLVDTTDSNTDLIAYKAITTAEIDAIVAGEAE